MNDSARTEMMAQMRREGRSFAEIGAALSISRQRVHQLCKDPRGTDIPAALEAVERARQAGADMKGWHTLMAALAAERADAIRDALDAGLSQAEVARMLGISTSAVFGALRKH